MVVNYDVAYPVIQIISWILTILLLTAFWFKLKRLISPNLISKMAFSFLIMLLFNLICLPTGSGYTISCTGILLVCILAGVNKSILLFAIIRFILLLFFQYGKFGSMGYVILLAILFHGILGNFLLKKFKFKHTLIKFLIILISVNILILIFNYLITPTNWTFLDSDFFFIQTFNILLISLVESIISKMILLQREQIKANIAKVNTDEMA